MDKFIKTELPFLFYFENEYQQRYSCLIIFKFFNDGYFLLFKFDQIPFGPCVEPKEFRSL
jgi:hypothetical protein